MTDPLDTLAAVPPPRRSDAAFARAVQDGLAERRRVRGRALLAVPALAAVAIALVMVREGTGTGATPDAGVIAAGPAGPDAELIFGEDGLFAIPGLEGSSDEELAHLDRALDRALAHQREL